MKSRPTIFLSGVSHEFGSFRDAVENEIEMKGCFAENQPGFPPDWRTVEEMLRQKLTDSDAVVHIVGFRFGAEPKQRPAGIARRSYTQMEFDIARELQKPVYQFLSASKDVRDTPKSDEPTEDDEMRQLQLDHRSAIKATNHLRYTFGSLAELCKLVAEIPVVAAAGFRADISRIVKYAPAELIGREAETALLNEAWLKVRRAESPRPHILTFVALGGEGKTSLVAKWTADLAALDWPGCDVVFAWSFYSQGTREQTAVSSDLFLAEALTFFGDAAMAGSAQGAFEKGKRLAQLVGARRALLILDGLEPLQYAPTSPTPGELKDQGLSALLKGLAATSHGLCVVTTRYALPDLRAFLGRTVREEKLARLARAAGVQLLKAHGVTGSDRRNLQLHDGDAKSELVSEFEKLVEDVDGHALTLHIMGSFLKKAFGGDIRKRDRVTFAKASQKTDNDHAFRAMEAYAHWMEDGSDEARRELAILRLMGLFDRPATADCLAALLAAPAIPGLTEPLTGLPEEDWNCSLESLVAAKLLSVSPETVSVPASAFPITASLDAHPLIREYFAVRVRSSGFSRSGTPGPAKAGTTSEEWREAHRRLYEHLCASTKEGDQPTLEALQPLYQAVAHGCQAGFQQEAYMEVYWRRIIRMPEYYSIHKLGAFGSDLGAVANFFTAPWATLGSELSVVAKARLPNQAAFYLRALGRLTEAVEPMKLGLATDVSQGSWKQAAAAASNLSELELTLGEVAGAVGDAEQSVTYADRSGDAFQRMARRANHADALHQAGRRAEAEARFREAGQMQAESQPAYPLLYSLQGFRYCDLLLAEAERAAWQVSGRVGVPPAVPGVSPGTSGRPSAVEHLSTSERVPRDAEPGGRDAHPTREIAACRAVSERAAQTLKWVEAARQDILSIALDHLTLGRAALYAAILESPDSALRTPHSAFRIGLRRLRPPPRRHDAPHSARPPHPRLAAEPHRRPDFRASRPRQCAGRPGRSLGNRRARPDAALPGGRSSLSGAALWIAECGLRNEAAPYPWESPQHDLAEARRLIVKHGYLRRLPELEDAESAILGASK